MVEIFDNIRKLYQFRTPCEELADYIEFFSETSLDATNQYITSEEFTVKLFPSYTPTIWINLGSPYHLKNGNKEFFINAGTDILLLRSDIVERTNRRSDNIFTIKFHHGGFEAVFGIEQRKIGTDVINTNTVLSPGILFKLKNLGCFEERTKLIQQHFLARLNLKFADQYLYKKVLNAVRSYELSDMTYKNKQVAEELTITDRTLYRYFKSLIGISPKNYFSIIRTRTALTSYVANKKAFSPYAYGYYDMSHFRKDVFKFTKLKLSIQNS